MNPLTLAEDIMPAAATEWKTQAACRWDPNPDLWFADSDNRAAVNYAKAICHQCPVRRHCLNGAQANDWGIWGGLTRQERRALQETP